LIGSLQDAYALARKSVTALQHDRVADRIGTRDGFSHRFRERIGRHGNAERTRGRRQDRLVDARFIVVGITERFAHQSRDPCTGIAAEVSRRVAHELDQ